MRRTLEREDCFANLFIGFLLARNMRTQSDLVDQLFNSSEKRLARVLLLMAEFGRGRPRAHIDRSGDTGGAGRDDWGNAVSR